MKQGTSDARVPARASIVALQAQRSVNLPIWRHALADLSPAYFGLVMATGIVSIAASLLRHPGIARPLFLLNIAQYFILIVLYVTRMLLCARRFFADLADHRRGPGYFTLVAGTGVLASEFILQNQDLALGTALSLLTALLWFVLTYALFFSFTIKADKPALDHGISGGWLLAVVATQAVAVCASLLAGRMGATWHLALNLTALAMWLWGGMLYIWLMALIFYRCIFFRLSPDDLSPPYWISMGAMAISTLAGSLLIENAPQADFLRSMLPFLKGFTLFYWASGTWWIPLLLLLGIWRYGFRRFPFRYDPLYWGAVFPLGMYATCTWQMNRALGLAFLDWIPELFFYAGVLAWALTFLGLLHSVARLMIQIHTGLRP